MKRVFISFILILLSSIVGVKAFAYDIAVENADGVIIYYNYINDGIDLEVTHQEYDRSLYSGNVVIPEEVTYMNRTKKVTSIGAYAFDNCSSLNSVSIPSSVTSIGDNAFYQCSGLTSVIIPNSVISIGLNAFAGCSGLTSVTISTSLTSIGAFAFWRCYGLTSVTIPNSLTSIGPSAFRACSLTSVTIPNSVTIIGSHAFCECLHLTSVTIPNSVTFIGSYAFYGCTSLTSVTIPNSVTSIGERAFAGWDLPVVISLIENPFNIIGKVSDDRTFSQNTYNNATLYVPTGTIDKYKTTDGWKDFLYIEEGTGEGGGTKLEKCEKPTISYSNGKLTFTSDTEGATCQYNITNTDVKAGSGNEVQLTASYSISVYASKEGYENSETATATLCWIDVNPKTEGIDNSVAQVRANAVMIQSNAGTIDVSGVNDGSDISVYSASGHMECSAKAHGNQVSLVTNLKKGEVAIIKIGDNSVKVVMQ